MSTIKTKDDQLQLYKEGRQRLEVILSRLQEGSSVVEGDPQRRYAESLNELRQLFERITDALVDSYPGFGAALEKFNSHRRLSREEFYLLTAANILTHLASDIWDCYHGFNMHFYEDDERRGYINPDIPKSRVGEKRVVSWGISPDEVRIEALSAEQKKYFSEHVPEVYQRFRK
jgi:hypothetical protein